MDKFFSRAPKEDDSDGSHTDFSKGSSRKKKKSKRSSSGSRKPEVQENAEGTVVGDDVLPHPTADLKQPDTVEFHYILSTIPLFP